MKISVIAAALALAWSGALLAGHDTGSSSSGSMESHGAASSDTGSMESGDSMQSSGSMESGDSMAQGSSQQMPQFDDVDSDGDGQISRSEFSSMETMGSDSMSSDSMSSDSMSSDSMSSDQGGSSGQRGLDHDSGQGGGSEMKPEAQGGNSEY